MRIAIFSDNFYPELSGISDSVLISGIELARMGHTIDYFVPRYSKKNYQKGGLEKKKLDLGPNIKIHRIFSFPFPFAPTQQGRIAIPNIFRAFINNKFDIIHTHSFFGVGIDGLFLSKMLGIPLVGTNHTVIESFLKYSPIQGKKINQRAVSYMNYYYNQCDFVTSPSASLIKDMELHGFHNKHTTVNNPIDDNFFTHDRIDKEALKSKLGLSPFTFLYVGRISSDKNIEDLYNGFISFSFKVPDADLVFVGHGVLRSELEKRAANRGLSSKIKFMGPFFGEQKVTLYEIFHASDIFVMPSLSEVQSMSILQAMASGMPIISAGINTSSELVNADNGMLFKPEDITDLERCMMTLYTDKDLREKISHNVAAFAQNFSAETVAKKWLEIYEEVIKNKKNA